jgi:hypothetical protein
VPRSAHQQQQVFFAGLGFRKRTSGAEQALFGRLVKISNE